MPAFNFNYEVLSAVAGMTLGNFYSQLFPKSVRCPQVIEFLEHLKPCQRRPVLVIRDRLLAHKCRMTQQRIEEYKDWICIECLPAHAPEHYPVEYPWRYGSSMSCPTSALGTIESWTIGRDGS